MERSLWELFRETGEPMSYLLCKAEERSREKAAPQQKPQTPPAGPPPASN